MSNIFLSDNIINTLRLRRNGRHFPDYIFKCIFLNQNESTLLKISLKFFVPMIWINNIPALVQIMAWRQPCDKPLSEPMLVSLLMHICVTQPQWVNKAISMTRSNSIGGEQKNGSCSETLQYFMGWHIDARTKWLPFSRQHFQMHFSCMKFDVFWFKFFQN